MTKALYPTVFVGAAIIVALPFLWILWGDKEPERGINLTGNESNTSANPQEPIYAPPNRGRPLSRVAGGTRSLDQTILVLLVPEHTGLTIQEQPTLYWFVSQPLNRPVFVRITNSSTSSLLMENIIRPPIRAGIQRLPLAQYGVHLDIGIDYQVVLEVAADPAKVSPSLWTAAGIEREAISPELLTRLKGSEPGELPALYAKAGLWYDALDAISEMIRTAPNDPAFHRYRASLLRQVSLDEVAMRSLAQDMH